MNDIKRKISWLSSISLFVYGALSLILGWIILPIGQSGQVLFLLLYCCALVPISWLSAGWLVWVYRANISNTWVWSMFQLLFFVSMMFYTSSVLGSLFSSLLLLLFPLLGLVNFLYAYKNGFSLRFIATGSIGCIWSILLAWRITGDLLDAWSNAVAVGPNSLWWLNALLYGFGCAVIAGIFAFSAESISTLSKEFSAE